MKPPVYLIQSTWWPDDLKPDAIADNFLATLDELGKIGPQIVNWEVCDLPNLTGYSLDVIRPKIKTLVANNVSAAEGELPDPRDGYWVCACSNDAPGEDGNARSLRFEATTGSPWHNRAEFSLGSYLAPPDAASVTYPIYRRALEAMVSIWPCPWARARVLQHSDAKVPQWRPQPPGSTPEEYLALLMAEQPPDPIEMNWIAYLSAPLAAGLTPSSELTCERTPGGGMILSAVLERPDLSNPEHIRRSRALTHILEEWVRIGDFRQAHGARIGPY